MSTLTTAYDDTQPIKNRIDSMRASVPVPFDRMQFPYHRRNGRPTLHFQRAQIVARIVLASGEDGLTHREITRAYEAEVEEPMERGYFNYMRKILCMTYNRGAIQFVAWKIPRKQETRYLFTSDPDKMQGNLKIAKKSVQSTLESKEGVIRILAASNDPDLYRAGQSLAFALKVLRDKPDPS